MKILINCIHLLSGSGGAGGAGKYVHALVLGLAQTETIRVLAKPENFFYFSQIKNVQVIPLIGNNSDVIHENLSWCDVYLCPLNELVPNCLDSRAPVVSCILDLQHEVYPHFFREGLYEARRKYYGYAISRSDAVITISQHEKALIQKIYGKKEVYVTYLAGYLAAEFSDQELSSSPSATQLPMPQDPYLLYPAICWRHKNHYRLIEALWILKQEYSEFQTLKLVLTGAQQHHLKSSALEQIITDLNMHDSVDIKGFVNDEELAQLIQQAKFMVFPSLYEGFGIPLVDAMNFGTPVLANALSAIPEVCGDAIAYFSNPLDSNRMAHDIAEFLRDDERRAQLVQLGRSKGSHYSLENTTRDTLKVLQQVVEQHRSKMPLNFVSAKQATNHAQKTARLTILLDATLQDYTSDFELSEALSVVTKLSPESLELCKIVNIIPFKFAKVDLKLAKANSNIINLYSDQNNASHYFNLLGYLFDSVLETDYMMYCPAGTNLWELDFAPAIASLDLCDHLAAISFTDTVNHPTEVCPLRGVELLNEYNTRKKNRLDFFNLKILRVNIQNSQEHLGTFKFLSNFLGNASYLNYPIRRDYV